MNQTYIERTYLVTFDLENSKNRTNDYKRAEAALHFRFGANKCWKLVKQCYIVRTNMTAVDIRLTLTQRLGASCNILVVRLRKGYAFKINDPAKRQQAHICLDHITD